MSRRGPEVFISYAHADNPPRYESRDWERRRGWVDCFHATLTERLRQVRGRPTDVWRDDDVARLGGASILTDTIRDALHQASVLIAVVSPSYCGSSWCEAELQFFLESLEERGGIRAGNRLRVLKVNKLPPPGSSFLGEYPLVADSVGYAFHRSVDGLPLEFDPPHGGGTGDEFCRRVNALAHDLTAILDIRETVASSGTTVYLAACSADVAARQERLRSELRQYGHDVLPVTGGLSLDADAALDALARASISLHVIGEPYDNQAEREYDLAGAVAAKGSLLRLSWMPPGLEPAGERQRAFVERLRNDEHFAGTTVELEHFKTIVKAHLAAAPAARKTGSEPQSPEAFPAASMEPAADDLRRVYLIFDPPDREGIKPLDDWLYEQGFEVVKTAPASDAVAFRKLHNGRLKSADGVLIYHGSAGDEWLEAKLDELWKVFSTSRHQRPKARGVVLADPPTPYKQDFRARIARVIPGFGAFDPALLAEFVDDVRRELGPR